MAHIGEEFRLGLHGRLGSQLGADQVVLELMASADIAEAGHDRARASVRFADDRRVALEPDILAVGGEEPVLALQGTIDQFAGEQGPGIVDRPVTIIRMDEFEGLAPQDLFGRIAQQPRRRRCVEDGSLHGRPHNHVRGVIRQHAKARLALAQRQFAHARFGDIHERAEHRHDLSVRVALGGSAAGHVPDLAIGSRDARVESERGAVTQGAREVATDPVTIVGVVQSQDIFDGRSILRHWEPVDFEHAVGRAGAMVAYVQLPMADARQGFRHPRDAMGLLELAGRGLGDSDRISEAALIHRQVVLDRSHEQNHRERACEKGDEQQWLATFDDARGGGELNQADAQGGRNEVQGQTSWACIVLRQDDEDDHAV